MKEVIMEVNKRTFAAKKYPVNSPIRKALNGDAITSEYMPSHKYLAIVKVPESETRTAYEIKKSFKSKAEAEKYVTEFTPY